MARVWLPYYTPTISPLIEPDMLLSISRRIFARGEGTNNCLNPQLWQRPLCPPRGSFLDLMGILRGVR